MRHSHLESYGNSRRPMHCWLHASLFIWFGTLPSSMSGASSCLDVSDNTPSMQMQYVFIKKIGPRKDRTIEKFNTYHNIRNWSNDRFSCFDLIPLCGFYKLGCHMASWLVCLSLVSIWNRIRLPIHTTNLFSGPFEYMQPRLYSIDHCEVSSIYSWTWVLTPRKEEMWRRRHIASNLDVHSLCTPYKTGYKMSVDGCI